MIAGLPGTVIVSIGTAATRFTTTISPGWAHERLGRPAGEGRCVSKALPCFRHVRPGGCSGTHGSHRVGGTVPTAPLGPADSGRSDPGRAAGTGAEAEREHYRRNRPVRREHPRGAVARPARSPPAAHSGDAQLPSQGRYRNADSRCRRPGGRTRNRAGARTVAGRLTI